MISIILFGAAIISLLLFLKSLKKQQPKSQPVTVKKIQQSIKINHGPIQVLFGSQTGTAAKWAELFAEQATEKGWKPQVIDLKDIKFQHFNRKGQISVFFLANTGQGEVPDNAKRFVQIIKKKEELDQVRTVDWSTVSFTIFGLGNTQYEFYNKTAKDVDGILETRGAHRVYKLGLGDNNASLQDDYVQWKQQLWNELVLYRKEHPIEERVKPAQSQKIVENQNNESNGSKKYLNEVIPELANFRFYVCQKQADKFTYTEDDLDFKTKASLKSEFSSVTSIKEVRQNTNDGSTLELEINLQNSPEYQTAGNIGLYPKNDPKIIEAIIKYFKFTENQLQSYVSVEKLSGDKKLKLNFIPYCKLIDLIESHIDIQGRLTKSVLKKLSKFNSQDKEYFVVNSSPKTTVQFKRITEETNNQNGWYYLFRIIEEKKVQIGFQDFIELSDSIAPRLFTIGSSYKKQKTVTVMASIIQNGLISKFFNSKPGSIKAELRKSAFNDAMNFKKVIFISVGTGFAPFRGYLQEKQLLMERAKNGQNVTFPKVTLFFGCKKSNGDFIYKQEIENWVEKQVINVLHAAFSRQQQQKVYVQHLLQKQENEIKEYIEQENSAIYICGSLGMGSEVSEVLAKKAGGHEKIKELEKKGRIIKQLW